MPGLSALDVQEALARQSNQRPVIFLTGRGTVAESVKAMKAGAVDYLLKPVDEVELLSAIKSAEERDKTQRDVEARNKVVLQRLAKLTPRERQTLEFITEGLSNKQIASALGLTEKTIKFHRGRLFKKMAARTLAELLRMTLETHALRPLPAQNRHALVRCNCLVSGVNCKSLLPILTDIASS
jgi:FixJ family two-component response regulator